MSKKVEVGQGRPLKGVKVLDLTSVVMGPFATQILASLGADVVKVEAPAGDTMRHIGPMRNPGMGALFLHANQGKRSVVLDLKHPQGLAAVLELARSCDVLISNVRPQAMVRLGLGYDAIKTLNPRVVYASCCGFDQAGPYANKPAYDDLIQGATGLPWLMEQYGINGPCYVPTTLADRITGLHAVYAVTAALFARQASGYGQCVEIPMFEAMTQFILADHAGGLTFDPPIGKPGYSRLLTPHRRPYRTKDGALCVLVYNDKHWRNFFDAIGETDGLAQNERFTTQQARAENIDAIYRYISEIMLTRTTAEWRGLLDRVDVPNFPMNSVPDLMHDEQHAATGFLSPVQHPSEGTLRIPKNPIRWNSNAPETSQRPAPALGQHTIEVLREAGIEAEQIDELLASGAAFQGAQVNGL